MEIKAWGATDVGLKRENNQDSILINKPLKLYIVADGMGGHKGGEVASDLAVKTVLKVIESQAGRGDVRDILRLAYQEASGCIHHTAKIERPELDGMGTTMVLGYVQGDQIFFGNVGDSRAYLFSENELWQITEDHSLVNEQIRSGMITPAQAENVVGKNVITRSVGFEESVKPDIYQRTLKAGEGYLFCSDGLCGLISDEMIAEIVESCNDDQIVPRCIEEAKAAGGDDNISVIFLRIC